MGDEFLLFTLDKQPICAEYGFQTKPSLTKEIRV
jgi:hypothetical protein